MSPGRPDVDQAPPEPARPFNPSPYNFAREVSAAELLRSPLTITDVTLREGQQASAVAFSIADQVAIARALEGMGATSLQVGYAGDDEALAAVRSACPDLRLTVMVVGWHDRAEESLRSALDAGADVCSIMMRAGPRYLKDLGLTTDDALARVQGLVRTARETGWDTVVISPTHTMMAEWGFLMELYRRALDEGADVVSISDSQGKAKPAAVRLMVSGIRDEFGAVDIRAHMHDDYGLALANSLAAVEAGANWVDATVNGLGERAGNCALEELVLALEALYGVDTGFDLRRLYGVSRLVERLSGTEVPPRKSVVGADCFANQLEIHVRAAANEPSLMEPYDPALVGNERSIRLGLGSGPTGIRMKLAAMGLALPEPGVHEALRIVEERARDSKRVVEDHEFEEIVRRVAADLAAGGVAAQGSIRATR